MSLLRTNSPLTGSIAVMTTSGRKSIGDSLVILTIVSPTLISAIVLPGLVTVTPVMILDPAVHVPLN